jgi:hypothetical protein
MTAMSRHEASGAHHLGDRCVPGWPFDDELSVRMTAPVAARATKWHAIADRARRIAHLAAGAPLAHLRGMTRSYGLMSRRTRRITQPMLARQPRRVDANVTLLGFTCFRLEREADGFAPVESLFPRMTMAALVRPPSVSWL